MGPKRAPGVTDKLKIKQAVLIGELHKMDQHFVPASTSAPPAAASTAPLPNNNNKSDDARPTQRHHRSDSYRPQQPATTSTSNATKTRRKASPKSNPIKRLLVRIERRSHRNASSRPE
jgi:hypothetical protein